MDKNIVSMSLIYRFIYIATKSAQYFFKRHQYFEKSKDSNKQNDGCFGNTSRQMPTSVVLSLLLIKYITY